MMSYKKEFLVLGGKNSFGAIRMDGNAWEWMGIDGNRWE